MVMTWFRETFDPVPGEALLQAMQKVHEAVRDRQAEVILSEKPLSLLTGWQLSYEDTGYWVGAPLRDIEALGRRGFVIKQFKTLHGRVEVTRRLQQGMSPEEALSV